MAAVRLLSGLVAEFGVEVDPGLELASAAPLGAGLAASPGFGGEADATPGAPADDGVAEAEAGLVCPVPSGPAEGVGVAHAATRRQLAHPTATALGGAHARTPCML